MTQLSSPHTSFESQAPARDLRRTWRIVAAVCIVTGPILVTVLRALMPYWTGDDPAASVSAMAEAPGRTAAFNWLSVLCFPFVVGGVLGTAYAVRRSTPRLALIGGGFGFVGLTLASMIGSGDILAEAMIRDGFDTETTVRAVLLLMDHPTQLLGILAFVVGHLVGYILLGIAVARSRLVPLWAGAAIVIAQPVHVISAVIVPSRTLDVIGGWGLTAVGFAVVALAVLRTPDDEWDLPPETSTRDRS